MNWAGILICITPPYAQINFVSVFISGPNFEITVGLAGIHGPAGTGMHGPGVRIPHAAAVREAVMGLAKLMQTPKGMTFRNGIKSTMHPNGPDFPKTIEVGKNTRGVGEAPKGHLATAPKPIANPIKALSNFTRYLCIPLSRSVDFIHHLSKIKLEKA